MKVIGVLSGKGGVGKTTTVANTGVALSLFNKKAVLLDGNSMTPDLGLHLGLYSFPNTLEDVLKRKVPILEAIYHHPSGVDILPSSMSLNTAGVDLRDLKEFFRDLEGYDFVFLDSPPGLGRGIRATMEIADEILVVTNPEVPAITDALRLMEVAKKVNVPVRGIVLNKVRGEKYELSLPEVESVFDAPVIASIPEDARVRESIAFGEPIVSNSPYSPAAVAFKKLAARMIGEEYRGGFLDKLKSLLGLGRRKPAPQVKIEIKPVERPLIREAESKKVGTLEKVEPKRIEEYERNLSVLKEEKKMLEAKISRMESRIAELEKSKGDFRELLNTAERLGKDLAGLRREISKGGVADVEAKSAKLAELTERFSNLEAKIGELEYRYKKEKDLQ